MVERGSGIIVNIASVAGLISTPGMCHYNAAKHALAAFSECLGTELRGTGVHVLTVYPGPVRTPMEQAARERLGGGAADLAPTGTSKGLARLVLKAVRRRKRRVIFPRFYAGVRHVRVLTQWLTDRFTPSLRAKESGPPRNGPDSPRITQ